MLASSTPDEEPRKHHQIPEPTVVAAISLAAEADAWVALVSTLNSYAKLLFRDHGLAAGESPSDRVQDAISSMFPPRPTHGHEKRRKARQSHGEPNPITNTPPVVGALGKRLTQQLQNNVLQLQNELRSTPTESRRAAIEMQLAALDKALSSGTLHRLCERLRRIVRSNRFKATDNAMNSALLQAKSFSISSGDENVDPGCALTGREMQSLSPDQPDEVLQARHLREKILAGCDGDAFLRCLVEYKFANSSGRNKRELSIDDIISAADGPFGDKRWSPLTTKQRKAKIYKANEKLVAIKRHLMKEGEFLN